MSDEAAAGYVPAAGYRVEDYTWDEQADDFAAYLGLSREDVVHVAMRPTRTTLDPRTAEVGYPIAQHWSGDVRVTVGYRDTSAPRILHVMVTSQVSHMDGKQGAQKPGGVSGSTVPRSWRQLRKAIMGLGYSISTDTHPKVTDKETGDLVYTLPGTPSDHRSLPNSWRAFLRAHERNKHQKELTKSSQETQ